MNQQWAEILRDPMWQFIGAALGLLAIAAGFVIYFLQKSKKSLAYEIVSDYPLLTAREEVSNEIQVTYKGKKVENIRLFLIKIINNGNQPVESKDFETPITVTFPQKPQIMSAEIYSVKPKNLHGILRLNAASIEIDPLLLNSGDFITVKLICDGNLSNMQITARISGVPEIVDYKLKKQFRAAMISLISIILMGISVVIFIFVTEGQFIAFILFLAAAVLSTVQSFLQYLFPKIKR